MREFDFLDYCTEYSSEGSINKEMNREACFGKIFRNVNSHSSVKYKIILYSGVEFAKTYRMSNACIFSKQEIRNHLKLLKSLYPIHYSVRDDKGESKFKRFIVTLRIENTPSAFHKYALTWIRYLYEFPYNMILRDAYYLKKESIFRFESIANLFNVVLSGYCSTPREIHQIPTNSIVERMKIAEVKNRLKSVIALNNIYNKVDEKSIYIPTKIQNFSIKDIEYWDNGFEDRKPVYIEIYKKQKR